jgi:hypothetical protein
MRHINLKTLPRVLKGANGSYIDALITFFSLWALFECTCFFAFLHWRLVEQSFYVRANCTLTISATIIMNLTILENNR